MPQIFNREVVDRIITVNLRTGSHRHHGSLAELGRHSLRRLFRERSFTRQWPLPRNLAAGSAYLPYFRIRVNAIFRQTFFPDWSYLGRLVAIL